jgi:hypothetical protein
MMVCFISIICFNFNWSFIVQQPPARPVIVIRPGAEQTIRKGDTLTLECRVTAGEPTPMLEWQRIDNKNMSPRVSISQISSAALFLTITNADSADFGKYTCTAKNSIAVVTEIVTVIEGIEI